mgnify:CR=1 FL=1
MSLLLIFTVIVIVASVFYFVQGMLISRKTRKLHEKHLKALEDSLETHKRVSKDYERMLNNNRTLLNKEL